MSAARSSRVTRDMARVLRRLLEAPGVTVTTADLLEALYGDREDGGPDGAEAVLHQYVSRLRRELPAEAIDTLRGYRLSCGAVASARAIIEDVEATAPRPRRRST